MACKCTNPLPHELVPLWTDLGGKTNGNSQNSTYNHLSQWEPFFAMKTEYVVVAKQAYSRGPAYSIPYPTHILTSAITKRVTFFSCISILKRCMDFSFCANPYLNPTPSTPTSLTPTTKCGMYVHKYKIYRCNCAVVHDKVGCFR